MAEKAVGTGGGRCSSGVWWQEKSKKRDEGRANAVAGVQRQEQQAGPIAGVTENTGGGKEQAESAKMHQKSARAGSWGHGGTAGMVVCV